MRKLVLTACCLIAPCTFAGACPAWLDVEVKKLRSEETVNLCDIKQDKVLLIVNTASRCGFTPQFKGLEKIYQSYKSRGFEIIGFPSDSFKQELDDEAETAKICYVNYGVTFNMISTSPVKGNDANPVFAHLNNVFGEPKWNFYKYLIGRDGSLVARFDSRTTPESESLVEELEEALN